MDFTYLLTPGAAWFFAGTTKFLINSVRSRRWAFGQIGYGGLPSNHTAIVTSMATLIGLKEGVDHPAFGVALALAVIVMLDARSLRMQIGKHAQTINLLVKNNSYQVPILREKIGHTSIEILAGAIVGMSVAVAMAQI